MHELKGFDLKSTVIFSTQRNFQQSINNWSTLQRKWSPC